MYRRLTKTCAILLFLLIGACLPSRSGGGGGGGGGPLFSDDAGGTDGTDLPDGGSDRTDAGDESPVPVPESDAGEYTPDSGGGTSDEINAIERTLNAHLRDFFAGGFDATPGESTAPSGDDVTDAPQVFSGEDRMPLAALVQEDSQGLQPDALCLGFGTPSQGWCLPVGHPNLTADIGSYYYYFGLDGDFPFADWICEDVASSGCDGFRRFSFVRFADGTYSTPLRQDHVLQCAGCQEASCAELVPSCEVPTPNNGSATTCAPGCTTGQCLLISANCEMFERCNPESGYTAEDCIAGALDQAVCDDPSFDLSGTAEEAEACADRIYGAACDTDVYSIPECAAVLP